MDKIIPTERVESKIYVIRGQKVMIDKDLAALYGVSTKALNQAVRRNEKRFPLDFVFSLSYEEKDELVTNCDRFKNLKHSSRKPLAFTEQGVSMLSAVLRSDKAIEVSVLIMRAFVRLRNLISSHKALAQKIEELEKKYSKHEVEITTVFKLLKRLMSPPEKPKGKFGFDV